MVGPRAQSSACFLMNVPVGGLCAAIGCHDVRSCDRKGMILLPGKAQYETIKINGSTFYDLSILSFRFIDYLP